jgi:hypothetical protein
MASGDKPREEAGADQSPFYAGEQQSALVLSGSTPSSEDFCSLGHPSSPAAPVDPRSTGRSRTTAGGRRGGGYGEGSAGTLERSDAMVAAKMGTPSPPKALTESDAMAPMESSHSLSRIRRVVFFHALFSTSVQLLLPEKTNQVLKV